MHSKARKGQQAGRQQVLPRLITSPNYTPQPGPSPSPSPPPTCSSDTVFRATPRSSLSFAAGWPGASSCGGPTGPAAAAGGGPLWCGCRWPLPACAAAAGRLWANSSRAWLGLGLGVCRQGLRRGTLAAEVRSASSRQPRQQRNYTCALRPTCCVGRRGAEAGVGLKGGCAGARREGQPARLRVRQQAARQQAEWAPDATPRQNARRSPPTASARQPRAKLPRSAPCPSPAAPQFSSFPSPFTLPASAVSTSPPPPSLPPTISLL